MSLCDVQPDPFLRFQSINYFNKSNMPNQLLKALHYFSQPKPRTGQKKPADNQVFSWGQVCIILMHCILIFVIFTFDTTK